MSDRRKIKQTNKQKGFMDYHFKDSPCSLRLPSENVKEDGIGEVRGVLRWQSVVECIHMVGLVTFLSGLPASLTHPPVFPPLPGMMEMRNQEGDRSLRVCVCLGVCFIMHMFF